MTATEQKIAIIKDNVPKVYEAGIEHEHDRFWDKYQNNGRPANYTYAFSSDRWDDTIYNPKYPINANNGASYMFYRSYITDTLVEIDVTNTPHSSNVFDSSSLKTIRRLKIGYEGIHTFRSWFSRCYALENISIDGMICQNISFADSPLLSDGSLISIVYCLKNYADDDPDVNTRTITFNSEVVPRLSSVLYPSYDVPAFSNMPLLQVIEEKGWILG